jgi:hypothetical protein
MFHLNTDTCHYGIKCFVEFSELSVSVLLSCLFSTFRTIVDCSVHLGNLWLL